MIRKDMYDNLWYKDDDDENSESINLTEIFGKGKEPKSDYEVKKLIHSMKQWFGEM